MSKILKVKNKEALKGAIDLGIAMQLTNIARDVCEDKARNRQYVSHDFLAIQEIINESQIFMKIHLTLLVKYQLDQDFQLLLQGVFTEK
jgi:phytoene synthase